MGKIASLINNIIIGTEAEEEHDKLVEEMVKRLVENDLCQKSISGGKESRVFKSGNRTRGD